MATDFVKKKKRKKILVAILLVILTVGIATFLYCNDYYHANELACQSIESSVVTVREEKNHQIVFVPKQDCNTGIVFYPGGKVQYEAYAPLMEALADRGILCVLFHMPANLAVLDVNAADGVQDQFPQIEHWYMAGHSLGGAMAASYLGKHMDDFEGLILLAAYSTADIRNSGLKVLSIYGSEDQVMQRDKYEKYQPNLPDDFTEVVLEGGCHGYFGSYGMQKGDGTPSISNLEQIELTAKWIRHFIFGND